jgi:hypothetical protein
MTRHLSSTDEWLTLLCDARARRICEALSVDTWSHSGAPSAAVFDMDRRRSAKATPALEAISEGKTNLTLTPGLAPYHRHQAGNDPKEKAPGRALTPLASLWNQTARSTDPAYRAVSSWLSGINRWYSATVAINPRRRAPSGAITYTSPFQYSLTSYLRTSSTQVVSTSCRGISRS